MGQYIEVEEGVMGIDDDYASPKKYLLGRFLTMTIMSTKRQCYVLRKRVWYPQRRINEI